ncbi:unnamed protein product [Urochloa humidicola]
MAPSSTSSCSPPKDHQYNLRSKRAKRTPKMVLSSDKEEEQDEDVQAVVNCMKDFNIIQEKRNQMLRSYLDRRQKEKAAKERKVLHVMGLARECGASEGTPQLWLGVLEIIRQDQVMDFFIGSSPEGRMTIIKHFAEEDAIAAAVDNESDDSEDEFEEELVLFFLEDDASAFMYSMYEYAMHVLQ